MTAFMPQRFVLPALGFALIYIAISIVATGIGWIGPVIGGLIAIWTTDKYQRDLDQHRPLTPEQEARYSELTIVRMVVGIFSILWVFWLISHDMPFALVLRSIP